MNNNMTGSNPIQVLQEQIRLLRRDNRRLQQSHKAAQEFVDNVSHDFRTPLTVIKDYVSIIRDEMVGTVNEEQRNMLDKVAVRADDLNNMVDNLLDITKLESGSLSAWRRKVHVKEVFEHVETLLLQRAQVKNVELTLETDPSLPDVYCDSEKLARVITNLVINAMKFAGDVGCVRLWAQSDPTGNQVVIGVTDKGPGIDKQSLDVILQRFRQLASHGKSTSKGFGLGLNIAQQFCRINLGELTVRSELGKGSTFSFTVPIAEPSEILRRWLTLQQATDDSLQLLEITCGDEVTAATADEFNNFLNCLPRNDDLLLRMDQRRWLQVTSAPTNDADNWFVRAKQERDRVNRNRPFGPMPEFHAEVRCEWGADSGHDRIMQEFESVAKCAGASFVLQ